MEFGKDLYKILLENMYEGVYFVDNDLKIQYWSKAAEKITGYKSQEVLDQYCTDNILGKIDTRNSEPGKRVRHLTKVLSDGSVSEEELYLRHKNGNQVLVRTRVMPIRNKQGDITGAAATFINNVADLKAGETIKNFKKQAYLDFLTGLGNRRFVEMQLNARLGGLRRYGWDFGFIFMDVTGFKKVNDTYGHDMGDTILKIVAKTLYKNSRSGDLVGRWGGDEFVAIVQNINAVQLSVTAIKYRILVEKSTLTIEGKTVGVSIATGTTLAQPDDTIDSLVKRADTAMYENREKKRQMSPRTKTIKGILGSEMKRSNSAD
ncbi:MAG: diguanylate cyclase [Planctomycetes bacterium]|nr:diguanylate cyclase [Planctomycetota bacterium]